MKKVITLLILFLLLPLSISAQAPGGHITRKKTSTTTPAPKKTTTTPRTHSSGKPRRNVGTSSAGNNAVSRTTRTPQSSSSHGSQASPFPSIGVDRPQISPSREKDNTKVYDVVEQMPSFPGGDVMAWLSQNITYPNIAAKNGVQGRVVVQFVIEKDGSVTDVHAVKKVDPSLDREAERVVRSMPRWSPGRQNGAPVRVKYTLPVTFKLS